KVDMRTGSARRIETRAATSSIRASAKLRIAFCSAFQAHQPASSSLEISLILIQSSGRSWYRVFGRFLRAASGGPGTGVGGTAVSSAHGLRPREARPRAVPREPVAAEAGDVGRG